MIDVSKLNRLAQVRASTEIINLHMQQEAEKFNALHRDETEALARHKAEAAKLEAEIRTAALEEFARTGEKSMIGGVKIRLVKVYDYGIPEAFDWCKAHQMCIIPEAVDRKAFEKLASVGQVPAEVVAIRETPQATIPTHIDLASIDLARDVAKAMDNEAEHDQMVKDVIE